MQRVEIGHGRIKESGNLNGGGLYAYESSGEDVGRCWRPDLIPAIGRWMGQVPPCDWKLFVGFGITSLGGFVAHFVVPDRMGMSHEVTIKFDHNGYLTANEYTGLQAPHILDYNERHLFGTANLI